MKFKCSNGHENFADRLPERCPACGSGLLRIVSGGFSGGTPAPHKPAPAPAEKSSAPPAIAPLTQPQPVRSGNSWLLPVAAVIVLVGLLGLSFLLLRGFSHPDTDQQMAAMAKQYENAVGVVILSGQKDGQPVSEPIATAWAVGDRTFVSNGHVATPVSQALSNGLAAFIVLNKNPDKKFRIIEAVVHPKYSGTLLNAGGKLPAVPVYDVGLLKVDANVPNQFKLAPDAELRNLDSGYRVAYLGFPMEGMNGGGVDPENPVANMQSGIITSTSDYWLSKVPFEQSLLLSHNLAAAGGSSGSPIFNARGEVVGVLSAGNINLQFDKESGLPTRTPSAVLINFAQRIDILRDIYPDYKSRQNDDSHRVVMLVVILILGLVWIYPALCFWLIARKVGVDYGWMAWIPVLQLYLLCRLSGKSGLWVLLCLIPFVGFIFILVLLWKLPAALGVKSGARFLIIVPFIDLIYLGYLAFRTEPRAASAS